MTAPYALTLRADHVALFIDPDGTLIPFADDIATVGPEIERNCLLRDILVLLQARLAIISGRSVASLDHVLEGRVVALAGCSGLQRRDARFDMVVAPAHPRLAQATSEIAAFARKYPEIQIDATPVSVGFSIAPNLEITAVAEDFAEDLARRTSMSLERGERGFAFLPPGMNKGRPVRAFMVEPPFAGSIPLFVGADPSCEAGFQAVNALGGFGILVGEPRETHARFRLAHTTDATTWLRQVLTKRQFDMDIPVDSSLCRI